MANNRRYMSKNIYSLITRIKKLDKRLEDVDENEIITICLSNRINNILKQDAVSEQGDGGSE